jgi:hypothetical protein
MDQNMQGSADTGTRDETYDIIAVLYHALQGAENCELYAEDASDDQELRQFFEQSAQQQRQLAEQGKRLLHDRLMREVGGGSGGSGSAFGQFSSGGGSGMSSGMAGGMAGGGGSNMSAEGMGSSQDRQGGSAYTSGTQAGMHENDQSAGQFGQSALGQGQRHNEMTTGGGGTSSF